MLSGSYNLDILKKESNKKELDELIRILKKNQSNATYNLCKAVLGLLLVMYSIVDTLMTLTKSVDPNTPLINLLSKQDQDDLNKFVNDILNTYTSKTNADSSLTCQKVLPINAQDFSQQPKPPTLPASPTGFIVDCNNYVVLSMFSYLASFMLKLVSTQAEIHPRQFIQVIALGVGMYMLLSGILTHKQAKIFTQDLDHATWERIDNFSKKIDYDNLPDTVQGLLDEFYKMQDAVKTNLTEDLAVAPKAWCSLFSCLRTAKDETQESLLQDASTTDLVSSMPPSRSGSPSIP